MLTRSGNSSGNASREASGNVRRRRPRRRARQRTRPGTPRGTRLGTLQGTRLIVPLAVPMALGLALGVVVAVSGGTTRITVSPAGAEAAATGTAANGTAAAAAQATPSAGATPATPAAASANMDCELIVPPNPLSAAGLATPYQLTGPGGQDPAASGCTQANPNLQAFVQATILNPATGRLWVYEPLVVTLGSAPAVTPVRPKLPPNAVVNLMVGFNGNNLQLAGARPDALARAKCVDGLEGSLFGQVSYCNSVAFYAAADQDIAAGKLRIPPAGRSPLTGQPCPTTRSFQLVDQDPSDNVTTKYLLTAGGQTAQDTPANAALLPGAMPINNGSDNALLDNFVLPALGCRPFTAPDLSDAGRPGTSQTLDELSAAASQQAPVALVPENDPMTLVNGSLSRPKTNLYRLGVGQPLVEGGLDQPFGDSRAGGQQADTPANFCANMLDTQTAFIAANQAQFSASPSPVPATGNNLFTFMAARLSASFANLGCGNFGLKNTVTLTQEAQGVATAAAFSLVPQVPSAPAQSPTGTPAPVSPTASPWTPWTPWGNAGNSWGNAGNPWGNAGDSWGNAGDSWGNAGNPGGNAGNPGGERGPGRITGD